MEGFDSVTSRAYPVPITNCDTDQLVPARFLSRERALGFGEQLFCDLRLDAEGRPIAGFALNDPAYARGQILLSGANFGCGSSRESAVWALADFGVRVVIAPSFGDIFYGNCFKNGLLAVVLPAERVQQLLALCAAEPATTITVDLPSQTVRASDGGVDAFKVDPLRKQLLLSGMDEIQYTLASMPELERFEAAYGNHHAWL
jgi:3-isopropylmalate/(R)-2-methylmalate dehydratase small subunit